MREKMKGIPLLAKTILARDSEPRVNSQLGPVDMEVGDGVKKTPPFSPLRAILQPRHPEVHFLKIIEWSLST